MGTWGKKNQFMFRHLAGWIPDMDKMAKVVQCMLAMCVGTCVLCEPVELFLKRFKCNFKRTSSRKTLLNDGMFSL